MEALVHTFSSVGTLGIILLAISLRDPPKVPSGGVPSKGVPSKGKK